MGPLVSIIIPAYNARPFVDEAIDSALGQTYPNCEVIVVDDGSTDGTGEWLEKQYGERIRYFRKANGGLSSARNLAMRHAMGEYVQFLDADDLIHPEKAALHAAYLQAHPDVDVVYCHGLRFQGRPDQDLRDWPRQALYRSGQIFASMIDGGYLMTHMTLSRRECLDRVGGFDESLTRCVDWDFWLRLAHLGAAFSYLEGEPMAFYRTHENDRRHGFVEHAQNGLRVLAKVEEYVPDPGERQRIGLRRSQGRWHFRYGKALAEGGHLPRGMWMMALSLLRDRRDLDYKLTYMGLALLVRPRRAAEAQAMIKRAKSRLFSRTNNGSHLDDS